VLRPCITCGAPGTGSYCAQHQPAPWSSSTRRARTLSGWDQQRRAHRVLRSHGRICHVCGQGGATVVDHVVPLAEGGADAVGNLRPIHAQPCHAEKTAAEAARARANAGGGAAPHKALGTGGSADFRTHRPIDVRLTD
jgi:5-methylcytosine-specific restriction endonuclease McrA